MNPIKVALGGLKKASQLLKSAKSAVNEALIKHSLEESPRREENRSTVQRPFHMSPLLLWSTTCVPPCSQLPVQSISLGLGYAGVCNTKGNCRCTSYGLCAFRSRGDV